MSNVLEEITQTLTNDISPEATVVLPSIEVTTTLIWDRKGDKAIPLFNIVSSGLLTDHMEKEAQNWIHNAFNTICADGTTLKRIHGVEIDETTLPVDFYESGQWYEKRSRAESILDDAFKKVLESSVSELKYPIKHIHVPFEEFYMKEMIKVEADRARSMETLRSLTRLMFGGYKGQDWIPLVKGVSYSRQSEEETDVRDLESREDSTGEGFRQM